MMRAIRAVSVERGRDPRQFALLAFGGNGPLFAAAIATELGISRIIVPPLPGVFSAFGLLVADTEHHASQSLRMRLDEADAARIESVLDALTATGSRAAGARWLSAGAAHIPPCRAGTLCRAVERDRGTGCLMAISCRASPNCSGQEHERNYGFRAPQDEPVELMGSVSHRAWHSRPPAATGSHPAGADTGTGQPVRLVSRYRLARDAGGRSLRSHRNAASWPSDHSGIRRDLPGAARLRRHAVTHSEISGSPARPDGRGALWERFPVSR